MNPTPSLFPLLSVEDISVLLDMSEMAVKELLAFLQIPTFNTWSVRDHTLSRRCSAFAFELALFSATFTSGDIDKFLSAEHRQAMLHDPAHVKKHSEEPPICHIPEYWLEFRKNPYAMQMILSLSILMYGVPTERQLNERLVALSNMLFQGLPKKAIVPQEEKPNE